MTVKDHEIPYYQQRYKVALAQHERMQRIARAGEYKYKNIDRVKSMAYNSYTFMLEMSFIKDENLLYINTENYDRLESVASRFNTSVTL